MNMHNFMNRQLCEYHSIFPNVASVLDHLFFTIGNGYDLHPKTGGFYSRCDESGSIDQYPEMTPEAWTALIDHCHRKEQQWATQYKKSKADLAAKCAKYKPVAVDDSLFSAESLFRQLQDMQRHNRERKSTYGGKSYLRPYPLDAQYSDIFKLNDKSPAWLLKIAINLSKAWIKFLTLSIDYKDVWVYQAPVNPEADSTEEKRDYADMGYTTQHRDMLVENLPKLEMLYKKQFSFKVNDKVTVAIRDPEWVYAGCAEPMPGMNGKIVKMNEDNLRFCGWKVAVSFSEATLGYSRSDKGNITVFVDPITLAKR